MFMLLWLCNRFPKHIQVWLKLKPTSLMLKNPWGLESRQGTAGAVCLCSMASVASAVRL